MMGSTWNRRKALAKIVIPQNAFPLNPEPWEAKAGGCGVVAISDIRTYQN